MRKMLVGLMVLALSFLLVTEWSEPVISSENGNQPSGETKDKSPQQPESKPAEAKPAAPKPNDLVIFGLKLSWKITGEEPATATPTEPKVAVAQPGQAAGSVPAPFDPALEEIIRLREENGSLLRGTLLEKLNRSAKGPGASDVDSAKEWFTESLQRVAKETPVAPRSFADRGSSSDDPPPLLGPTGESEPTDPASPPDIAESIAAGIVLQLRATSRAFDERANDLEEQRRYDDAKRLRKLSEQIRAEARRLDVEGN